MDVVASRIGALPRQVERENLGGMKVGDMQATHGSPYNP